MGRTRGCARRRDPAGRSREMCRHARTAIVLVAVLLSGCAGASSSAVTAPSPSVAAIVSTPPTASPPPPLTPMAVLSGDPWIVYGWADDHDWYVPQASGRVRCPQDPHRRSRQRRSASWSRDGRTLAFVVQDTDNSEGSIWTANADGSGSALLSAGGTEFPVGRFHPAWSADGTKLAQVTNVGVESGDQRNAESGDRRAAIVQQRAWLEGHLTTG